MERISPVRSSQPWFDPWQAGAGLAATQLLRQAVLQRHLAAWLLRPDGPARQQEEQALWDSLRDLVAGALAWPFDLWRTQHAAAVNSGLKPRSLLESSRFEHKVAQIEQMALGPLARGAASDHGPEHATGCAAGSAAG